MLLSEELCNQDQVAMGKGSKPRPASVSVEEFSKNWDKIFKNAQKKHLGGSLSGKDPV